MPDTISFARGAPSPDLIPVDAVRQATAKALEDDWKTALSYGVGIGHPGLCAWIADRHGLPDAGQVMVTNGSLEAGGMLFSHLLGPGDRVVVEQPSYDRTLLMLKEIGVEFVPIPLESDGIDVDALEAALAAWPALVPRPGESPGRVRAVVECLPGEGAMRLDEVNSAGHRTFLPRFVRELSLDVPLSVQEVSP